MQKDESAYSKVYGYQKVKYSDGTPVMITMYDGGPALNVYKLVNLYGDGRSLTEYYNTLQKSELENGTVKLNTEYSNDAIIRWLGRQNKLTGLVQPTAAAPVAPIVQPEGNIEGQMTYVYGNNKRSDVSANTTFDAILNGERTATTRYASDGKLDYWKNVKVGDTITWKSGDNRTVDVIVTKALQPLVGSGKTAEQWSKLEGWSVNYFNNKVKPKLDGAWQIEFKLPESTQPTQPAVVAETKPANIEVINKLEMAKNKLEAFEVSTDGILYNYFRGGARLKASSFDELVDRNLRSASTNGAYISKDGMPYDNLATSAFEASGMPMDNEYAVEALREFLTNYPDNWKTPYNNIINEIDSLEEQLGGREMTVKVDKKDITIKPTGEMFFADGKPVTDTVLQNQASIVKEKRNQTLRTSISGGFNFFILSDNKILLSGKNNVGKEYIADPEMMQRILDKAVIYKIKC
jgi:hypothetical protein